MWGTSRVRMLRTRSHRRANQKGGSMRFRATSIVLVAVAALVAGCGGSNNGPTLASTTPPGTTAPTTSAGAPSFASAGHCADLSGLAAKYAQAVSAASSGGHYNL